MSSQPGGVSQFRANWNPEWHKLFVLTCLKQVKKGNRPKTHLNKQGWKELGEEFNRKTGVYYDKGQLKNHWDSTKDSWKVWHKLIFNIGDGWDPVTQQINVSDDFWDDYIQKNPSAARFRHQILPHLRELDYIFGGTTAIADFPNSDAVPINDRGLDQQPVGTALDVATPNVEQEAQQSSSDIDIMAQFNTGHVSTPAYQGVKRKNPSDVRKIENMLEKLVESVESKSRNSCTLDSEIADKVYTIKDCVEILNQMPEVSVGSELYLDALDIFKKKSNREFFVSIPPEVRLSWLRRQI